jgi:restriction endonuclease S subunit
LEGLEISEVRLSDVLIDNDPKRIDSEYFRKKYLIEDKNRNQFQNLLLGNLSFITDGQHGYHEVDENSNIRQLTAKNAKGFFANDIDADRIAKWVDDNNKRSSLETNDLILSTRGTVGACAIVGYEVLPANIDQDVARIKITKDLVKHTVLATYINSKFGQDWIIRNQTGMVQQGIALWRVRQMPIPIFVDNFQNKIDNIVIDSKQKKQQSQYLYRQAEDLLLNAIDLQNFKSSVKRTIIKSYKKSFLATGRLDAEYYQPKYEEIENKIKKNKEGYSYIYKLFKLNNTNIIYSEKQYNYIEIGDINIGDGSYVFNLTNVDELPANAKIMSKSGDLLISKVRPNRGAVSIINKYIPDLVVSGAFTVLEENSNYKKEVLFVLLRTTIYKEWLLKYNVGTSYPIIKDEDILNMPIPLIASKIQNQIVKLIKQSFSLRAESECLLDEAKNMVEKEIEGGKK